jgi:hypothetical protein
VPAHVGAEKSWDATDRLDGFLGYDLIDRHVITEHGRDYTEHVYQLARETG